MGRGPSSGIVRVTPGADSCGAATCGRVDDGGSRPSEGRSEGHGGKPCSRGDSRVSRRYHREEDLLLARGQRSRACVHRVAFL